MRSSFILYKFFLLYKLIDTTIILYPELYFKYLSKNYTVFRILKNVKFFKKLFNISFYSKLINLFESYYANNLKKINNKFISLKNYGGIFNTLSDCKILINKVNIKNFILLYVMFSDILYKHDILLQFRKKLYLYKPSKIIKRIFLRNYFYYRSRRYQKKPVKYNFRLFYFKKLPISKINKIRSLPVIFWRNKLRTIYYRNYKKFLFLRLKKFWNYFFSFFLQNIKKRFFFSNFIINQNTINIKYNYENYIYDLLLFLKKFFLFNVYLKKHFNLYSLNKRLTKFSTTSKKKITSAYKNLTFIINKTINLKRFSLKNNAKKKLNKIRYIY